MDNNNFSESEEMYLISIVRLIESGEASPVPVARLAEAMHVQPVSANQMVNKLQEAGGLTYLPYKGVELTPAGQQAANHVLRHRRLWEVFLVEHLQLSPVEADEVACKLEHDISNDLAERLASILGHPTHSPQGKLIPPASSQIPLAPGRPLAHLRAGQSGRISQLQAAGAEYEFLQSAGLTHGVRLSVLAVSDSGARLARLADGRTCELSAEMAELIRVID